MEVSACSCSRLLVGFHPDKLKLKVPYTENVFNAFVQSGAPQPTAEEHSTGLLSGVHG